MNENCDNRMDKSFRDKLGDYSEPVDAGAWNSIEKEALRSRKMHLFRRNIWAAAASVAVLLGLGLGLWKLGGEKTQEQIAVAKTETKPAAVEDEKSIAIAEAKTTVDAGAEAVGNVYAAENTYAAEITDAAGDADVADDIDIADASRNVAQANEGSVPEHKARPAEAPVNVMPERDPWMAEDETDPVRKIRRRPVAIAFAGGGNISSMDMGKSILAAFSSMKKNDASFSSMPAANGSVATFMSSSTLPNPTMSFMKESFDYSYTYNVPVSFGIFTRFALKHGFSLETGIYATAMSGKAFVNGNIHLADNSLWYLGVPVKVNYSFYSGKYVDIYASLGGAADFCVSQKFTLLPIATAGNYYSKAVNSTFDGSLKAKDFPVQFSVNAAVGVQWNIVRFAAIFFEPGVSYYFAAKNPIETIRDQKPFYINFQGGVRFSF